MARVTWLSYLVFAFGVMPLAFYVRFGRSPVVFPVQPRNWYDVFEYLYGLLLVVFTTALLGYPSPSARGAWIGFALLLLGVALQWWSVHSLGPHWRIGQDTSDASCAFVRAGPYRVFAHPIYLSMCLVALGQAVIMGWDWRSLSLVIGNFIYGCVGTRRIPALAGIRGPQPCARAALR